MGGYEGDHQSTLWQVREEPSVPARAWLAAESGEEGRRGNAARGGGGCGRQQVFDAHRDCWHRRDLGHDDRCGPGSRPPWPLCFPPPPPRWCVLNVSARVRLIGGSDPARVHPAPPAQKAGQDRTAVGQPPPPPRVGQPPAPPQRAPWKVPGLDSQRSAWDRPAPRAGGPLALKRPALPFSPPFTAEPHPPATGGMPPNGRHPPLTTLPPSPPPQPRAQVLGTDATAGPAGWAGGARAPAAACLQTPPASARAEGDGRQGREGAKGDRWGQMGMDGGGWGRRAGRAWGGAGEGKAGGREGGGRPSGWRGGDDGRVRTDARGIRAVTAATPRPAGTPTPSRGHKPAGGNATSTPPSARTPVEDGQARRAQR